MRGYKKDVKRIVQEIKNDLLGEHESEPSFSTSDEQYKILVEDWSQQYPGKFPAAKYYDITLVRICDGHVFAADKRIFDAHKEGQMEFGVRCLLELAGETERSIHRKKDGRVFQMFCGLSKKPMTYFEGKHNYTKKNLDELAPEESLGFQPMYGNKKPVPSILVRLS